MASEMDALYAKIGASNASLKEDVFRDGKGVVELRELLCKRFFKGNTFVARCKVVSSASKGDVNPVDKTPVIPNAPGSSVGWPQMLDQHASAPGNVKAFVLALLGFSEAQVTGPQFAEALEQLISKAQPGRGMLIGFETYQQATRSGANAGRVNTYVRWTHIAPSEGNDKVRIAERRAELDKTSPLAA
jgi:hypothetical protein